MVLMLFSGLTCSHGDLLRSVERYYLTSGFSLDSGNWSPCSFLFPTILGIFTPD